MTYRSEKPTQDKLNFKLTSTTSFDNRASRLPTPYSPGVEHRKEVVAHTGTEEEYQIPVLTDRPGEGTEEQESVLLLMPDSNPSLNSRDFDAVLELFLGNYLATTYGLALGQRAIASFTRYQEFSTEQDAWLSITNRPYCSAYREYSIGIICRSL